MFVGLIESSVLYLSIHLIFEKRTAGRFFHTKHCPHFVNFFSGACYKTQRTMFLKPIPGIECSEFTVLITDSTFGNGKLSNLLQRSDVFVPSHINRFDWSLASINL